MYALLYVVTFQRKAESVTPHIILVGVQGTHAAPPPNIFSLYLMTSWKWEIPPPPAMLQAFSMASVQCSVERIVYSIASNASFSVLLYIF